MGLIATNYLRQTIFLILCGLASSVSTASDSDLRDLAARLQYAAFTEDLAGLRQSLDRLKHLEVEVVTLPLKQNYQAYGEWKLAEALASKDKSAAAEAAERCADGANPSAAGRGKVLKADQLALQTICFDLLGELRAVRAVYYQRKRDQILTAAIATDAVNPRVLLAQALTVQSQGQENQQRITRAVAAFDEQVSEPGRPDWGYPEALIALGSYELKQGNALAARNALEKALVLVPEYRRAQILLDQAAVR